MQEVFHTNAGPLFVYGERIRAKGVPVQPIVGKKVPFQNYSLNEPTWPYAVLTMPHEAGNITASERFELLEPTTESPKIAPALRGDFAGHHWHRPDISGVDIEVTRGLEKAESFYCTGKGCWACKKKAKVNQN